MKVISIEMPEKLAIELENYVKAGWFKDRIRDYFSSVKGFPAQESHRADGAIYA